MTKIKFLKKNGFIVKMELDGHTGFSQNGSDILCAAISAISQSVVLGIKQVVGCPLKFERNEKHGYLSCTVLSDDIELLKQTQILFDTALIAFKDIQTDNKKYMKVEVCDEIY